MRNKALSAIMNTLYEELELNLSCQVPWKSELDTLTVAMYAKLEEMDTWTSGSASTS